MAKRMRIGRKRLNWRFLFFMLLVLFVFMTVQTIYYIDNNLRPTFMEVAYEYSEQVATDVINTSISQKIAEDTNYNQLLNLRQAPNGQLTASYFNMQEAARIQTEVTDNIQTVLKHLPSKNLSLPLGQAFHIGILANTGPNIPITIQPIGAVKSSIGWETRDVGINQTVHILYLDIDVETAVIIPFSSKETDTHTKVPIAYLVMVGNVPEMVLNSKGESVGGQDQQVMPPLQLPNLNDGSGVISGSSGSVNGKASGKGDTSGISTDPSISTNSGISSSGVAK